MITGLKVTGILQQMEESKYNFQLTGSRYFTPNEAGNRDYDFFVQKSDDVEAWLQSFNFTTISKKTYGDSNCYAVYRSFANELNPQVDVQIVNDFKMKAIVQDAMRRSGLNPTSQVEWNFSFEIYKRFCKS